MHSGIFLSFFRVPRNRCSLCQGRIWDWPVIIIGATRRKLNEVKCDINFRFSKKSSHKERGKINEKDIFYNHGNKLQVRQRIL